MDGDGEGDATRGPATGRVSYRDASDTLRWAEVSAETARAIESFDRAVRRRDAKYLRRARPVETAGRRAARHNRRPVRLPPLVGYLNVELEPAFKALFPRSDAAPWEGARYSFTHLLGEGPSWPGPGTAVDPEDQSVVKWDGSRWVCAFCGGGRLLPHQCCLGCARTGRG